MPAYDIRYLNSEGFLAHAISAVCDDDQRAKVLVCALKLPSCKRLEVWSGEALVHMRPVMKMPLAG